MRSVLVLAVLLSGINYFPPRTTSIKKLTPPMVSFVFDDGYETDRSLMLPLFQAKGAVANSAIVTSYIGTPSYMTLEQIEELEVAGWEIVSHSDTHACSTPAQLQTELASSRDQLVASGFAVTNFASPCGTGCSPGESNRAFKTAVLTLYRSNRCLESATGANAIPIMVESLLALNADNPASEGAYLSAIGTASGGAWVVFYIHQTDATDAAVISHLIDRCATSGVSIVTVGQALTAMGYR